TLLSLLCPSDLCRLPADPGACYAMIPHWFHDWQAKKCEKFTYGGCDGKKNNFETQTKCLRKCGRGTASSVGEGANLPSSGTLPTEMGLGAAAIPRWVCNWHAKKCEEFSYGGCHGNKNNFETKVDCLQACAGQGKTYDNLGGRETHSSVNNSVTGRGLFTPRKRTVKTRRVFTKHNCVSNLQAPLRCLSMQRVDQPCMGGRLNTQLAKYTA
uniref:BPTI/Kunitz inhibitor domain-containing protein n=1 Tax=Gopherus agassizii TaxID=38772 RepID=A0A452IJV4_9SAUR